MISLHEVLGLSPLLYTVYDDSIPQSWPMLKMYILIHNLFLKIIICSNYHNKYGQSR